MGMDMYPTEKEISYGITSRRRIRRRGTRGESSGNGRMYTSHDLYIPFIIIERYLFIYIVTYSTTHLISLYLFSRIIYS
jgi:hypothetical protein